MKSKRIIATLSALSICLLISVSASNSQDTMRYVRNTKTDMGDARFSANMADANEANTNLQLAFARQLSNPQKGVAQVTQFPDYYAGSFVNANGELVVLLNDGSVGSVLSKKQEEQAQAEIRKLAKTDKIIFGKAKYSYSDLSGVMAEIKKFLQGPDAKQAPYIIRAAGIDEHGGKVNVYLSSVEPEALAWFRNTISASGCVNFIENKEDTIEATASVAPGDKIKAAGSSGGFSAGFRARKASGTLGFVTVSHSFVTAGGIDYGETVTVQNSGSVMLGTSKPADRQFFDTIDAAFIEKTSSTTVTNTVYDASGKSYTIAAGYSIPAQGSTIYMCGQTTKSETDDLSVGEILETEAAANYKDVTIFDLYMTSHSSQPGDSGGICFVNSVAIGYLPAGIQAARNTATSYSYVCKAKNIVNGLGVTPY